MSDLSAVCARWVARPNIQPMLWTRVAQVVERLAMPHRNRVGAFPLRHARRSVVGEVVDPDICRHAAAVTLPGALIGRVGGVCKERAVARHCWIRAIWSWKLARQSAARINGEDLRRTWIRSHSERAEEQPSIAHPICRNFSRRVVCHSTWNAAIDGSDIDVAIALIVAEKCNRLSIG